MGDGTLTTNSVSSGAPETRVYNFPSGVELIGDNAQFALAPDSAGLPHLDQRAVR